MTTLVEQERKSGKLEVQSREVRKTERADVRAHEDLDGPDVVHGDLETLAGGLVETEGMPQLIFRDSSRRVDLVAEDEEGDLFE